MKIVICDDEKTEVSLLHQYVTEWARNSGQEITIDCCYNGEQFFFLWEEKKDTDILLLDIEMPGIDGMALARKLREQGEQLQIIFITGVADYVWQGYEVDAVSYLLKPVKLQPLYKALDRAAAKCAQTEPVLVVDAAGEICKTTYKNICFLESAGHETLIYTTSSNNVLRSKTGIQQLELTLQEKSRLFYRMHRSYLVNLTHIERITRREVVMDNGAVLPIARGKWEALNQAYLHYFRGSMNDD